MRTTTFNITSYDVYENGRLKLSSIMKYMQQLAREDAEARGSGYLAMREKNMVFVITRMGLKFFGDIYDGDTIKLTTFIQDVQGVTYIRNFYAEKDGKVIMTCATDWVLIDYVERKLLRPSVLGFNETEDCGFDLNVSVKRRIAVNESGAPASHVVRYTELDENKHLNNTVYADIVVDNLTVPVPDRRIETFYLNFNNEAGMGDNLEVYSVFEENTHKVSAQNRTNGKQCFGAELTFFGD